MRTMIIDGISYSTYASSEGAPQKIKILKGFVDFLQTKLGATLIYAARNFPFDRPELADVYAIADNLRERGVLESFFPRTQLPD